MKNRVWIESKAAAQAKNDERAVNGWQSWIDSDDESRAKLAQEKARNAAIKFSQRIGKSPASVLQFAEDAAQEAIMFIYYEMEDASERAPESILSFIAGKYISSYYYRSAGRNGKDNSLDEYENLDSFLYSHNVFGHSPESSLLTLDSLNEIISEIKPKYRDECRIIVDALKAGYTQTEIASAMNTSQQVINYRIQQIKAAARIVTERDKDSAEIERRIESDENMLFNMAIRK